MRRSLILALAACSSGNGSSPTPPVTVPAPEPVQLTPALDGRLQVPAGFKVAY